MTYRHELPPDLRERMWRLWTEGATLHEIGHALDRDDASIHQYIARRGGVGQVAQERSDRALTFSEREEISLGLARGETIRSIARQLNRAPSTVSREIKRNRGHDALYRASRADARAWRRAKRPKPCRLSALPRLRQEVVAKLELKWSPEF